MMALMSLKMPSYPCSPSIPSAVTLIFDSHAAWMKQTMHTNTWEMTGNNIASSSAELRTQSQ